MNSGEKEFDWYGFARYLEARIERSANEADAIAAPLGALLSEILALSNSGHLQRESNFTLFRLLPLLTQTQRDLTTLRDRIRGIENEFLRVEDADIANRESNSSGAHRMGENERETTPETSERDRVPEPGRSGARGDHSGSNSEERGTS